MTDISPNPHPSSPNPEQTYDDMLATYIEKLAALEAHYQTYSHYFDVIQANRRDSSPNTFLELTKMCTEAVLREGQEIAGITDETPPVPGLQTPPQRPIFTTWAMGKSALQVDLPIPRSFMDQLQ